MVEHVGWQSVFFLNVPIGIVAFIVATVTVTRVPSPSRRATSTSRGLILGTGALFFLTYGLIEANQQGLERPADRRVPRARPVVLLVAFLIGSTAPNTR